MQIPEHVLSAFQLDGEAGVPTGPAWDDGTRFGRVVLAPAGATAAWSGKVRERASAAAEGVRISRPVRATDGRLVVGGFRASEFVEGEVLARIDEAIAAALRYDDALAGSQPPAVERQDPWAEVDRAIWQGYQPEADAVVAHLNFLSCLVFSGDAAPTLTDLVPSVGLRPRGFSAALVMVDGLLAGAVDAAVVDRWDHIPGFRGLAQRALTYRVDASAATGSDIRSIAGLVADTLVSG